ncbi:MAG: extracellular solute-binding protein [Candidatus Hydrogenedentota bacterium]|uniref:Maltose/maltodextrin ABC transporter, substrate binding periplasmic protein MalE n=1 Tax=Sumerlaea chitinivorans TaxID=2250252 RepID=A0A2Z4Y8K8_SUMC1|nr:Maltose/maltodextrin ABC transporter, substrate binding periplasmic protein MalE [Candidatus Sumerlaea chitinivorans]RMH29022.1 MAG: extracellular solute-binding protein [Candidatus Hydrogenedentota bacterium]
MIHSAIHQSFVRYALCFAILGVTTFAVADKRAEIAKKIQDLAQPVTLVFWQTHNAEETATLKDIIADFEREHPKVKIAMDTVAFAEAQTKFKTAAKAGNAPDCFRCEVAWTAELAELGYLTPLDDYLEEADKASYLELPMRIAQYKEETWGLPQVTDCLALLYNKRILREAGVEPPKTMDELVQVGKKITKPEKNLYAFAYPATDSYFTLPFIWAFGGGLIDEKTNEVLINNEGSVRGLQFMLDLRAKEKIVPPNFDIANDYNNQLEDFKAGRIAMIFMGPWATANILTGSEFKNDPKNLGVALLPSGPAGSGSPIGGHCYVVSASCKNADVAFYFLDWINSPKNQVRFTVKNNLLPTHRAAYDLPDVKSNEIAQAFRKQLEVARARPVIPAGASLFPPLTQAYQDALRGAKTPKEALDAVAKEWKKLLER